MPVTALIDGALRTIALADMRKRTMKEGGISVTKDASAVSSAGPKKGRLSKGYVLRRAYLEACFRCAAWNLAKYV